MSQNSNPFMIAFEGFQFPGDWDGDDITLPIADVEVDESETETVHEEKYARRDRKAARAAFAAKVRKGGK